MSKQKAVLQLLAVLMFIIAVVFTAYFSFLAGTRYSLPYPIRVLDQRREAFSSYAQRILDGKVSNRNDGQGFVIPSELANKGITYVRQINRRIVFDFESLPTDPTEQLIFCPDGFDGLPNIQIKGEPKTLVFTVLNERWFYWQTDW